MELSDTFGEARDEGDRRDEGDESSSEMVK